MKKRKYVIGTILLSLALFMVSVTAFAWEEGVWLRNKQGQIVGCGYYGMDCYWGPPAK